MSHTPSVSHDSEASDSSTDGSTSPQEPVGEPQQHEEVHPQLENEGTTLIDEGNKANDTQDVQSQAESSVQGQGTPVIAESTAGSLDYSNKAPPVLELDIPFDSPDMNSIFALLDHVQLSAAEEEGPARDLVSAVQKEHQVYLTRLTHAKTFLEAKYLKYRKAHDDELNAVVNHCKQEKDAIEDKLMDKSMAGPQPLAHDVGTTHVDRLNVVNFGKGAPVVEGAKLLAFWKDKFGELQTSCDTVDNELQDVTTKLNDLKYLCSTEQFKVHRVLGLLREKESSERLRAQGYETLLAKFAGNDGAVVREVKDKKTESFSIIEEELLDQEVTAVKRALAGWQTLSETLLFALDMRSKRKHILLQRLSDIRYKCESSVSLDAALEEVLELRSKVLEEVGDIPTLPTQTADIVTLREELQAAHVDYDFVEKKLLREIRERKVQVIRALQKSNGDVDSRFAHLRMEKCVTVVGNQLSVADSDRLNLKTAVAGAASEAKSNLVFLEKC